MTPAGFALQGPLVVRSPNWLGDAVMALPAVRATKLALGSGRLAVAVPEKLAALWQAFPFVDEVIPLTAPRNLWPSARQLRAGKFASALLLPNSGRAAAEAFLAGIPQRAGYARNARGILLTHGFPAPLRNPLRLHQRFYYLDLVAALGATVEDATPEWRPAAEKPGSGPAPFLAVCPGAEYGPAKRWPVENFAAAAKELAERFGLRIVVLGAAGDAAVAADFMALVPQTENRTGQTSLGEFMGTLRDARLVLCNDSGAMHLASVLGTPTVAIFGSTEPQMTGPLGSATVVLRHHVPCSPCFLRQCPIDFACMRSITPGMVVEAAERVLRAPEIARASPLPSST